jgi:hypothetical protein
MSAQLTNPEVRKCSRITQYSAGFLQDMNSPGEHLWVLKKHYHQQNLRVLRDHLSALCRNHLRLLRSCLHR